MRKAFSLLEVLFSLFLVALMAIMVATTLRAAVRSNAQTSAFLLARTLVTSKLSQLQSAGYLALNGPGLGQSGAKIVDGTPTSPASNTDGSQSARFSFSETNQLSEYFPRSSVSDAPQGWIYLAPYAPSKQTQNGLDSYDLIRATVQVQWRDTQGMIHSFSESTLIPRSAP